MAIDSADRSDQDTQKRANQLKIELHSLKGFEAGKTPPYIAVEPRLQAYGLPEGFEKTVARQEKRFEARKKTATIIFNLILHPPALLFAFFVMTPAVGFGVHQIDNTKPNYSTTAFVVALLISILLTYVVLLLAGLFVWALTYAVYNAWFGHVKFYHYDPDSLEGKERGRFEDFKRDRGYYNYWQLLKSEANWHFMHPETLKESVKDVYALAGYYEDMGFGKWFGRWRAGDFVLQGDDKRVLFSVDKFYELKSIDDKFIASLASEAKESDCQDIRVLSFIKPMKQINAAMDDALEAAKRHGVTFVEPNELTEMLVNLPTGSEK